MTAYYNEIDKNAAQWLRNLIVCGAIPEGDVDERPIQEVQQEDLDGYTQCHFFSGIGGWPLALDIAGWPRDRQVWTGSCPCQPYSATGKGKGDADPRNLWPDFYRLIRECRPDVVFGEQVASAIGHGWLDGVSADLEGEGYACGAVVLGAHSVVAPHIRQRLYWVGHSELYGLTSDSLRRGSCESKIKGGLLQHSRSDSNGVADTGSTGAGRDAGAASGAKAASRGERSENGLQRCNDAVACGTTDGRAVANIPELRGVEPAGELSVLEQGGGSDGLGNSETHGREGRAEIRGRPDGPVPSSSHGPWSDFTAIACRDGKARRVGRGVFPLVNGIPRDLGQRFPELRRLVRSARSNRVSRLRGYGNAIVPQVAAEFVRAFMESE